MTELAARWGSKLPSPPQSRPIIKDDADFCNDLCIGIRLGGERLAGNPADVYLSLRAIKNAGGGSVWLVLAKNYVYNSMRLREIDDATCSQVPVYDTVRQ